MQALTGWGINISFGQGTKHDVARIVQSCVQLRCEWVRVEFDSYLGIDDDFMGELLQSLTRSGIMVLGVLSPIVPGSLAHLWYGDRHASYDYAYTRDEFLQFCERCVCCYGADVHTWQIRNEQNTRRFWGHQPCPQEYLSCLREVLATIGKDNMISYLPGCVMGDESRVLGWYDAIEYMRHITPSSVQGDHQCQGIAFHPYVWQCYVSNWTVQMYVDAIIGRIDQFAQAHPGVPLWITEFGISRKRTTITDHQVAQVYHALYHYCTSRSIPFFIWGLLPIDHGFHPRNPEKYFNLLDEQWGPTSLYNELVTLMNQSDSLR